ncbi:hypothetical protein NBRC116592_05370 [Colwellia sp. KU-HH00111]|uniref:flagellar biosynthetic protein FliO n=1 Tax=Colwellia sp. KU-HH00111 TaxID=3127652 RepID=UPI003105F0EF
MARIFVFFIGVSLYLLSTASIAQAINTENDRPSVEVAQAGASAPETLAVQSPEVGKHVMANMDAASMIMSLLMVLALIIISALVLKRFNLAQQDSSQLKVIANLSLGAKERVVVVQIGEQQLVLGVCAQQITLLQTLQQPIETKTGTPLTASANILSFLQKSHHKKNTDSAVTTNKTTNDT